MSIIKNHSALKCVFTFTISYIEIKTVFKYTIFWMKIVMRTSLLKNNNHRLMQKWDGMDFLINLFTESMFSHSLAKTVSRAAYRL